MSAGRTNGEYSFMPGSFEISSTRPKGVCQKPARKPGRRLPTRRSSSRALPVWPSLTVGLLTHPPWPQIRARHSDVRLRRLDAHVRYPECLPVNLDAFQPAARQLLFRQSQESEVGQIAKDRLEPSVLRENPTDALVKKFVGVKGQHRYVLRSPRRGNR